MIKRKIDPAAYRAYQHYAKHATGMTLTYNEWAARNAQTLGGKNHV